MALHECLPLLAGGEVREMRQGHSQAEPSPDDYANGEPCHISSPKERQRMLMMLLASELSAKDIGENILIRDTNVHLKRDSESLQDSQAYWVAMSQSYASGRTCARTRSSRGSSATGSSSWSNWWDSRTRIGQGPTSSRAFVELSGSDYGGYLVRLSAKWDPVPAQRPAALRRPSKWLSRAPSESRGERRDVGDVRRVPAAALPEAARR